MPDKIPISSLVYIVAQSLIANSRNIAQIRPNEIIRSKENPRIKSLIPYSISLSSLAAIKFGANALMI